MRQVSQSDTDQLTGDEADERPEGGVHETVAVQADSEHIGAEPAPAGHNVTEDSQGHDPSRASESTPASVEDDGVPNYNEKRAVFFGVPAPEPPPGLVGPNAAQNGADEAEQRGEANNPIDHAFELFGRVLIEGFSEQTSHHVNDRQHAGEERGRIADGDDDHVSGQPEVGIEHGPHHFERVA